MEYKREKSPSGLWYTFLSNVFHFHIFDYYQYSGIHLAFFLQKLLCLPILFFLFCCCCTGKRLKIKANLKTFVLSQKEIGILLLSRSDFQVSDLAMNVLGLCFVLKLISSCCGHFILFLRFSVVIVIISQNHHYRSGSIDS